MAKFEDLTGKVFGRLTPIRYIGRGPKHNASFWECQCSCGNITITSAQNLKSGKTKSCGCLAIELLVKRSVTHGERHSRLYNIWCNIKHRCYNKNDPGYKNYGGRGITMCEEWEHSYISFRDWSISHGYTDRLTIDRIDNNGNYCPENCRWATVIEQCNNRRSNVYITYNGETHNITQWSKITGIKIETLAQRKRSGWSDKECIEIPVSQKNNQATRKNLNLHDSNIENV